MNTTRKSQIELMYSDEIAKNPELGEALAEYEAIMEVKRDIRKVCETDEPEEIKEMIGQTINDFEITEETYQHALAIDNTYKELYEKCKKFFMGL